MNLDMHAMLRTSDPSARPPKIIAALPRGEAIRNFVYSGALTELRDRVEVDVASVIPNAEIGALLTELFGEIVPLSDWADRRVVGTVRDLLDAAHGRRLWSEAAQERWRRRDLEVASRTKWVKRRAMVAAATAFARPRALELLASAYELSSARWPASQRFVDYVGQSEPSLVFNGSHVHGTAALGLMNAATALAVPTATFLFSWDNLTSQGRIIPRYSFHLAWSERIRDDLLRIYPGIDPDAVFVTGTPQFDAHFRADLRWSREHYCDLIGVDPNRPIVLYTTGMPNHMPGEPILVEGLADLLASRADLGQPQLVVRVYAKDRTNRFDDLRHRRHDIVFPPVAWEFNWLTPLPEDTAMWSNMVRHADVGVNVASTVSLELCMFDKPVVNIGYNPQTVPVQQLDYARYYRFDHYRPVVESGAVTVAGSPSELVDAIARAIVEPHELSARRAALLSELFGDHLDGRSTQRVVERLALLAGGPGLRRRLARDALA